MVVLSTHDVYKIPSAQSGIQEEASLRLLTSVLNYCIPQLEWQKLQTACVVSSLGA